MLPCLSGLSIHDVCPTDMPKRDRKVAEMDEAERELRKMREGDGTVPILLTDEEMREAPEYAKMEQAMSSYLPDPHQEEAEAEEKGEEEEQERDVQLLVLDFDTTLTTGSFQPSPNHATGISGRIGVSSTEVDVFKTMDKEEQYSLYGGREVVEQMRKLFHKLRKVVQLRILSYGKKESIVESLRTVRLLKYFTSDEATPGDLVFGVDVPPLNEGEEVYKAIVLQEWMDALGLQPDEVAFVDDQRSNIDEPEKGEGNQGAAQVLAPGHAHLHTGANFLASADWISGVCGLG